VDVPALRSYIGGMCRLICRRVVALAVAYAFALNLVLPLVAAFASPAEAAIVADLCTTNRSESPADLPSKPRPICPLACSAPGCGVDGLFADGPGRAAIFVDGTTRPLFVIDVDDQAPLASDPGAPCARAPPRG
jgi:hypothetical protein